MTVEERIAHPSRAFGALCRPVFGNKTLCLKTNRLVYNVVVLTVLLYRAETWANERYHLPLRLRSSITDASKASPNPNSGWGASAVFR